MRVVRDIFSADFERAIVDDEKQYQRLVSFFTRTAPELVDRVELHQGSTPLFEEAGVEEVIDGLISRRVDLPSGGYLMIDYAEALTVFDVNSGSFVGRGKQARLEDTITKTNLEAADEVVRQLRLRDIGGIIVIDFIDMAKARNREAVLKTFRAGARPGPHEDVHGRDLEARPRRDDAPERHRGRARDHLPHLPDLRRRRRRPQRGDGRDRVRPPAARARRARAAHDRGVPVQMNPPVSVEFTGIGARMLHELEEATGKVFHFEGTDSLPLDHFAVVLEGSLDEVHERAVPFNAGEEVLVAIVEPHMYNVDDAVAKIDGYIVSVSGGGRLHRPEAPRPDRGRGPQLGPREPRRHGRPQRPAGGAQARREACLSHRSGAPAPEAVIRV